MRDQINLNCCPNHLMQSFYRKTLTKLIGITDTEVGITSTQ